MASSLFTEDQKREISASIQEAEKNTSGEIQVHIENHCEEDVFDRAAEVFSILKMHKTAQRNGVLFYLAVKDHKFAILGDVGINSTVPSDFWENIKEQMRYYFRLGDFTKGLSEGIKMAGRQLKKNFPYQSDDKNELSDEISFGKN